MRRIAFGAVAASLVLLAGCSGDVGEPDAAAPEAPDPGASEVVEGSGTAGGAGGSEPAGGESGEAAAGGEPTVLQGSVGTPEDPEAFVISLVDASGEPVTTLPAGDYVIEVTDPATSHNFHLVGGSVDESTTVPETVETTFEVTLEPGEYTYVCDPHPNMVGTFTVTGPRTLTAAGRGRGPPPPSGLGSQASSSWPAGRGSGTPARSSATSDAR